jgi:hypothetical protein
MKKFIVKNIGLFESNVYGADDFLNHFPEIISSGVIVLKKGEFNYIVNKNGDIVSDSSFFSDEELLYLHELSEI